MAKARELQVQEAARLEELVNAVDLIQVCVCVCLYVCASDAVAGRFRMCLMVGCQPCVYVASWRDGHRACGQERKAMHWQCSGRALHRRHSARLQMTWQQPATTPQLRGRSSRHGSECAGRERSHWESPEQQQCHGHTQAQLSARDTSHVS